MSTKADLADKINELLGLNLESLEKMTKEDLEALLKVIGEPSQLIKIGWKNLRDKAKREILEELMGRPLLDEILKGAAKEGEDRGPLGFGVIPKARARIREIFSEKEAKE
jgi:hypothetical protein